MPALVLWSCVPSFCALSCIALCRVACRYGPISRFKGVFSGFWGFRVGLCRLGALRGLWGFCARVGLGGLKACGVFASVFLLLSLCLPLFYPFSSFFGLLCPFACPFLSSLLLSSGCPLSLPFLSLGVVVVSFSLTDVQTKRKGAISCVLSCPVVIFFGCP